jgi:hypothetical protein
VRVSIWSFGRLGTITLRNLERWSTFSARSGDQEDVDHRTEGQAFSDIVVKTDYIRGRFGLHSVMQPKNH